MFSVDLHARPSGGPSLRLRPHSRRPPFHVALTKVPIRQCIQAAASQFSDPLLPDTPDEAKSLLNDIQKQHSPAGPTQIDVSSRTTREADFPTFPNEPYLSSRREALSFALAVAGCAVGVPSASLISPPPSLALVPTTAVAGRVPGLSEPDERGWRTYQRPKNKSGGHGVGWSEFLPYSFNVPEGWEEVPVSIADLGGTEIDLRFQNSSQGKLAVVVAPVLRFADNLGSDARIEKVGPPDRVISAFGPEVTGESVEGKVKATNVVEKGGLKYYEFEVDPHVLISTTATGSRLYILALQSNGRQWKKFEGNLREILESFRVG